MNEKILQLAEQAGSTHKQNLGVYQFYKDELQTFAELIVLECARIAYRYEEGDMVAQDILFEFNVDNCRDQK